jgi:hypothetical protein
LASLLSSWQISQLSAGLSRREREKRTTRIPSEGMRCSHLRDARRMI